MFLYTSSNTFELCVVTLLNMSANAIYLSGFRFYNSDYFSLSIDTGLLSSIFKAYFTGIFICRTTDILIMKFYCIVQWIKPPSFIFPIDLFSPTYEIQIFYPLLPYLHIINCYICDISKFPFSSETFLWISFGLTL